MVYNWEATPANSTRPLTKVLIFIHPPPGHAEAYMRIYATNQENNKNDRPRFQ